MPFPMTRILGPPLQVLQQSLLERSRQTWLLLLGGVASFNDATISRSSKRYRRMTITFSRLLISCRNDL